MAPIDVVVDEIKHGWAVIRIPVSEFRKQVELERFPGLLDQTLTSWLSTRTEVRVRATLPIMEEGFTTVLHIWWD